MTAHLQDKGGANWMVNKQSHISISKAPGALFRENTVYVSVSVSVYVSITFFLELSSILHLIISKFSSFVFIALKAFNPVKMSQY